MRDLLWGNDVGVWREVGRLAFKVVISLGLAYVVHEWVARPVLFPQPDLPLLTEQVNEAFCARKIPVAITIEWKASTDQRYTALAYRLTKSACVSPTPSATEKATDAQPEGIPAAGVAQSTPAKSVKSPESVLEEENENDPDFYRLWDEIVSHPQVTDSLHVLVRRAEKLWKGEMGKELELCAESRRSLLPEDCDAMEAARAAIEGKTGLGGHLRAIKLGSLVLGPWQWLTLAAFMFAMIEALGLYWRWVRAPSYVGALVDQGIQTPLTAQESEAFESRLALASSKRVRSFIDRFLEKALSPSSTTAEERLRNFRDMQVDECVAKLDTLESVGDTMLKIAFMGTVFGIGTALFAARNLDAADPLLRLVAKSEMYAGIGMGFGATLVGILLSILAAKSRAWLSGAWLSSIDDAWRRATIFYDAHYGGRAVPATVPGVTPTTRGYRDLQKHAGVADRALESFLVTLGYLGIATALGYLAYTLMIRYGVAPW